ncbi:MAG TPA: DUF1173 family protein [Casimicrobiaceae bacterium]|jgi:hypothetical protein|nr:DUF1173 family protein [Casimicrobiaceae bacterium]
MDEQRFLINGRIFAGHDPRLQEALARIYGTPARPRCLCVGEGVEMYVSKFTDFLIKRMPETGGKHRTTCPSYELPASESGLGEVLGEAIIERGPDGVELRLDFPLTRRIGRSFATTDSKPSGEVTVARKQLSLRGLLHYLWERAGGFNRWYPRMQGKRSYWVLRKFLLQACEEVETKGLRLVERVFIPEYFSREQAAEIAQRRDQALSILLSPDPDPHFKMMIAIGELKELRSTTVGYALVLKHLPDCAFLLDPKAGDRTKRAFEPELQAWTAGQVRLIAACLLYAKREHLYQIESLTLMMTSAQWIPLDHACEKDVVGKLVAEQRAFLKPLRYEAKHPGKFPNFQLLDAGERPVALDILSAFLTPQERAAKASAIAARNPKGWAWDTAQGAVMPDLPPKAVARSARDASTAATIPVAATTT